MQRKKTPRKKAPANAAAVMQTNNRAGPSSCAKSRLAHLIDQRHKTSAPIDALPHLHVPSGATLRNRAPNPNHVAPLFPANPRTTAPWSGIELRHLPRQSGQATCHGLIPELPLYKAQAKDLSVSDISQTSFFALSIMIYPFETFSRRSDKQVYLELMQLGRGCKRT
jgi:hypothetical protein